MWARFGEARAAICRHFRVIWAILGSIFGVFSRFWAAPWSDLASGRSRDASGAAPGRLPGASGPPLGRPPGAPWAQVGALGTSSGVPDGVQEAPKMDLKRAPVAEGRGDSKRKPKRSQNGGKMEARWIQNEGKMGTQTKPKSRWLSKRKNQLNASRLAFSWVSGLEVGR